MAAEIRDIRFGLDLYASAVEIDFDVFFEIIYLDLRVCSGKIGRPVAGVIRDRILIEILTVICRLFLADEDVSAYLVIR